MTRTLPAWDDLVARSMSEKVWTAHVRALAAALGYRVYHTWRSDHSPAGFPDLVLVRPPRVIFAELKTERGVFSKAQWDWLTDLAACPGVETAIWRPSDRAHVLAVLQGEELPAA